LADEHIVDDHYERAAAIHRVEIVRRDRVPVELDMTLLAAIREGDVRSKGGVAKSGDDNKAIALYREAVGELASNPDVHVRLGMAYARQERLDESQAEFEAVLRIDPKSSIARQAIDAIVARRKATGK
jgi:tetratricopeptide (TPR) repeat protein